MSSGRGAQAIARAEAVLRSDHRIAEIVPPQPGATLSQDGRTAVVLGGAGASTNDMVRLVLLPVLLRLTGRAAWACPRWLRRALPSIRFSH